VDFRILALLVFAACSRVAPTDSRASNSRESTNPFAGNAAAAKAGEALFGSMNCDGCHGGGGVGFVGPSFVDGRWRFGGSDSAVFYSIKHGRAQGMPTYGRLLSDSTIWQLVAYLKSLPVPTDVATEAWP
jgi:mono/diheme cytochrome c family protein